MSERNRGKNTGDDLLFGPAKEREKLQQAVRDMHYLLSRDYPEKASSELVGNRYRLKTRQIQAFRGASASERQLSERHLRQIGIKDLKGKTLYLDGFNILILLESLLSGAYIFEGLDGCLRDLSGVHGTYKRVSQTLRSVELVADFTRKSGAEKIHWIFDQPVSNSGRIKQMVVDFATAHRLPWEAGLEFNPDRYLTGISGIAVSSDAWILDYCGPWFNLVGYLASEGPLPVNLVKMY